MDTTPACDQIVSGPEHEVIGVVENDLAARLSDLTGGESLNCAARADWHEGGGVKVPVQSLDLPDPGTRLRATVIDGEMKRLGHGKALATGRIQAEEMNPIICAPTPLGEYASPSRSGWQAPHREPYRGYDRLQPEMAFSGD